MCIGNWFNDYICVFTFLVSIINLLLTLQYLSRTSWGHKKPTIRDKLTTVIFSVLTYYLRNYKCFTLVTSFLCISMSIFGTRVAVSLHSTKNWVHSSIVQSPHNFHEAFFTPNVQDWVHP